MTVSTEVDQNDYTGNGVATVFPYQFRIFKAADLTVVTVDLNENLKELILGTDYTVTGAGSYQGGNVILTGPLISGWQISIARELPVTQETDLRNQGKFFAEVHENAFDKLTMLIQQVFSRYALALRKLSFIANYYDALNNRIRNLRDPSQAQDATTKNYVDILASSNMSRTLRVPEIIKSLPDSFARANKMIAFDNSGNPFVVVPPSGSASDVMIELAKPTGADMIGISGGGTVQDVIDGDKPIKYRAYTLGERLDEDISVGAIFGVDPSGATDSSAALQNFFNLLLRGRVTVPAGTYLINAGLVVSNNSLTISGKRSYLDGVSAVKFLAGAPDTTILTMTGYGSLIEGILFQGYENNSSDSVNGWGQGTTCTGVKYLRGDGSIDIDSILQDCSFNYFKTAVDAFGSNLQIKNNLFASNRISVRASALAGLQFRSIVIHRNRFHHCGGGNIANTNPTLAGTCCINLIVDSSSPVSNYAGAMQITNNMADAGCHTFFIGSLHRGSILSGNTLFRMSNGDVIKVNNTATFAEKSYDNFIISNNAMANDISRIFDEDQGSGYFITLTGIAGGIVANNTATNMRKGGIYCSSVTDVCFFNTQLKDINVWKSVDGAIYDGIAFDSACQNNMISKLSIRCAQAEPQFRYIISNNGTNLNVFGLRSNGHSGYLNEGASATTGGIMDARQRQRKEVYATAVSTLTGNFQVGDICWFTSPVNAGYIGAACQTAGVAPAAVWRNFGAVV